MTTFPLTRLALAAVARRAGDPAPTSAAEAVYLAEQRRGLPEDRAAFIALVREAIRQPCPEDAALARLATQWNLSLAETLSLALVAAIESDILAGRALAYLQAPIGGTRPTLGLLAEAFGALEEPKPLNALQLAHRPCFTSGTLHLAPEGAALPERPVSMALSLCLALGGEEAGWPGGFIDSEPSVPLADSVAEQCRRQAGALRGEMPPALVLRSAAIEETRAVACHIARALRKRAFVAENVAAPGLAAWLLLRELVPVFVLDPGPGETRSVPPLPLYTGPILVAAGVDGTIECPGREVTSWVIPLPNPPERETLWRTALPRVDPAPELARTHRLSAARIAQLGKLAAHRAQLEGRPAPDIQVLGAVSRSGEGAGLDALAQLVNEPVPDNAFVASPELRAELDALLARCRHRDGLTGSLGAAAATRYTAGVRALFVGPSGTGKTLAAGWLATRLGLPLYRVDLASITSKYIGETEKNLARLLARAERSEAVLLFDEADSLFGKRTDVRESNDRFANTQTNYLLQRIETYDGIALLTSNSRGRLDTAFSRRLDLIIEFPAPAPAERRALWQAHLGEGHALSMQQMNLLAGQCDFAGGQIRNVVFSAAVAARNNGGSLDFEKIATALQGEYRKAGRSAPASLTPLRR